MVEVEERKGENARKLLPKRREKGKRNEILKFLKKNNNKKKIIKNNKMLKFEIKSLKLYFIYFKGR